MIFADPPYFLSNGGFTCRRGRRVPVDKGAWDQSRGFAADADFHRRWIGGCRHVLKDSGSIWTSGTYHSIHQCGYALQEQGFKIINDIVWYKPQAAPNLSGRCFAACHESLIWAKKDPATCHRFNYRQMKYWPWPKDFLKKPGRQAKSVWVVPHADRSETNQGKHPTQKPIALLKRILLATTRPGDTVLDPFAGSSTTGIAAAMLGRRFIGIEREREYLELSIRRFEELLGGQKSEWNRISMRPPEKTGRACQ